MQRIALVTGAAMGFGKATASYLLSKGYVVACCDSSFVQQMPNDDYINEFANKGKVNYFGLDSLSTENVPIWIVLYQQIQYVLDTIKETYGTGPHVLVNCEQCILDEQVQFWTMFYTQMISKSSQVHSLDLFVNVINKNVIGYFNMVRLVSQRMVSNSKSLSEERGVIINTSRYFQTFWLLVFSISAVNGSGAQVAYSTAMAAIAGMTLPLARALGRYGIRCVGVEPGIFEIPLIKAYEDTVNILSKLTPFPQRLGKPEEFAHLIGVVTQNQVKCRKSSITL